jgi:hypothetical protein
LLDLLFYGHKAPDDWPDQCWIEFTGLFRGCRVVVGMSLALRWLGFGHIDTKTDAREMAEIKSCVWSVNKIIPTFGLAARYKKSISMYRTF